MGNAINHVWGWGGLFGQDGLGRSVRNNVSLNYKRARLVKIQENSIPSRGNTVQGPCGRKEPDMSLQPKSHSSEG